MLRAGTYNSIGDLGHSRNNSPSKRQGYTFGYRERTVDAKSTVGVRCHGPLASQVSPSFLPHASRLTTDDLHPNFKKRSRVLTLHSFHNQSTLP